MCVEIMRQRVAYHEYLLPRRQNYLDVCGETYSLCAAPECFEHVIDAADGKQEPSFPDCATECMLCSTKAVIDLEGQMYCLNCGAIADQSQENDDE